MWIVIVGAYVIRDGKKVRTTGKDENIIKTTRSENMLNVTVAGGHYLIDKHDSISTTDVQMVDIEYFNNNTNKNTYHVCRCDTNKCVIEILENTILIVSVGSWKRLLLCEIGIFIPVYIYEIVDMLLVTKP